MVKGICAVEGCERALVARSLCRTHYGRWWTHGDPRPDLPILRAHRSVEERFWGKVDRRGPDECWEWRGSHNGRHYGHFHPTKGTDEYAHRFSYAMAHGAIADGLHVRHRCDNPPCVNPAHLELGTRLENMADMVARGRQNTPRRPLSSHCGHGHEFGAENTYRTLAGARACRECGRIWAAARRARRRAAA